MTCRLGPSVAVKHKSPNYKSNKMIAAVPQGVEYADSLKKELVATVREQIGPFAAPDVIHWAPGLPKTRSGKTSAPPACLPALLLLLLRRFGRRSLL